LGQEHLDKVLLVVLAVQRRRLMVAAVVEALVLLVVTALGQVAVSGALVLQVLFLALP
jgi:hypothetical protein